MSHHFLEGIKLSGYRSLNEEVTFDNLKKINLIIGQNNSGKSNLLRFLTRHLGKIKGAPSSSDIFNKRNFDEKVDTPKHHPQPCRIAIKLGKESPLALDPSDACKRHLLGNSIFKNTDTLWFYYQEQDNKFDLTDDCISDVLKKIGNKVLNTDWRQLWMHLYKGSGGGNLQHWQLESLKALSPAQRTIIKADLIPATRTLLPTELNDRRELLNGWTVIDGIRDHSGFDLVEELFKLQNPPIGQEEGRERFRKINQFMCDVTGNESLQLEVPHDKSEMIVTMDDKRIAISDLGTGIEEILIIAAKSTLFSNQIVCIEEPELHLHPTLQRKLLSYLYEKTDNQYFIATHSAHLLNTVDCSIYHIRLVNGYSEIIGTLTDQQQFEACSDLGYKASDLLQSNFILWVEGPSDRIYLNHWINHLAPDLKEGLHYSIMFYGGRLLSHLTGADNEQIAESETVEEFISLQKLNRNMGILIDSDKSFENKDINSTKQRIQSEFKEERNFVWITEGREIENYLSADNYKSTLEKLFGEKLLKPPSQSQYQKMTVCHLQKNSDKAHDIDKIRLANAYTEIESKNGVDMSTLDLEIQIKELISKIRSANLLNV